MKIPDRVRTRDSYEQHRANYRQIVTRLRNLQTGLQNLQANITTNTSLQNDQAIFQNMQTMGLILNDLRQALKMIYGVQRDDDNSA